MKLTTLNWNVRKAKANSQVWDVIHQVNPDIVTLQEVISIPDSIRNSYTINSRKAINKIGTEQIFSTVILAKGKISGKTLKSEFTWVDRELEFFHGNLLSSLVEIQGIDPINVISVHSPAWPVNSERLKNIDVSSIKLKQNNQVWCTEILWAALRDDADLNDKIPWIIAGDFNSSVTFDYMWRGGPSGNQEIVDRLNALGLTECLKTYTGELTPTFRNPKGGKIIHQLDHVYVTEYLRSKLHSCCLGSSYGVFKNSISDHLPIISEFNCEPREPQTPNGVK